MGLSRHTVKKFAGALTEELNRQRTNLKIRGYPRPYYLSYLLRDAHTVHLWGRLGNLNELSDRRTRNAFCDCRVGSYRFDQVIEGGLDDHDSDQESYEHVDLPIGNDTDALKYHLWKLTDSRYREAIRQYLHKKSQQVIYVDPNSQISSFKRYPVVRDLKFRAVPKIDKVYWQDFVERSSRIIKPFSEIKNSFVELRIRDVTRLFVNSEGTTVCDQSRVCELSCELWLLTPDGEGVSTRIIHITPCADDLPDLKTFKIQIKERIKLLRELRKAPTIKSYAGPVLLAPEPAGIFFHEVLGHRLEGSRLLSTREGQTFKRELGRQILPDSISVYDDPSLESIAGAKTVGSYRYDDEGSPAKRADLIKDGVLKDFLSGRAAVSSKVRSGNGHARSEYHERPISRMGNLVIEMKGGISHRELKQKLLEQIRREKLRFGILVLEADGGETATEAYDFQAFMGTVTLAAQIWADGSENLIRNVNFVGTPLSALREVVAVGDTPVCINAFCGAESGLLPVSTTCPAVLLGNLELQASDQRQFAQYLLPMPHEDAKHGGKRRR